MPQRMKPARVMPLDLKDPAIMNHNAARSHSFLAQCNIPLYAAHVYHPSGDGANLSVMGLEGNRLSSVASRASLGDPKTSKESSYSVSALNIEIGSKARAWKRNDKWSEPEDEERIRRTLGTPGKKAHSCS